jgi:SSS family solute:Na+ symporter
MTVGLAASLFWLLFIKAKEAGAIGLVQRLTDGKSSLLEDVLNWPSVDPIMIALPLSILTAIVVSAFTQAPDRAHLARCFPER